MANGFAAAGFGTGFSQGFSQMLDMRRLSLAEERLAQEDALRNQTYRLARQRLGMEQIEKGALAYDKDIASLAKMIEDQPTPELAGKSRAAVATLEAGLGQRALLYGRPAIHGTIFDAAMSKVQSAEEKGRQKGAGELAQAKGGGAEAKVAEAEAMIPVTIAEQKALLPGKAALAGAETEARELALARAGKADTLTFKYPDGRLVEVDARDRPGVNAAIRAGAVKISLAVQALDVSGLGGTAQFTPKEVAKLRGDVRSTQTALSDLSKTMEMFAKTPEAGGIAGVVVEKGLNVLQQIPLIGEAVKGVTGSLAEEVSEARSQARITVAGMLEVMSGDKRFSNQDRAEAQAALQALSPTASAESIRGALTTVIDKFRRVEKAQIGDLERAANVDIGTVPGRATFYKVLRQNGYSDERAKDMIAERMRELQGSGGR